MEITKVGTRGYHFSFDDPYYTTIYVINGVDHIFVCDTFLGPDPMNEVISYLEEEGVRDKDIIVFNTHYDYDHIWGNQIFKDSKIISHESCVQQLKESGKDDLKQFESHKKGEVKLVIPNTTFKEKMIFDNDGVEFYHTPGHTADSSSCYDFVDKVLIVGDNLESPFPYIRILNIPDYINSLREYIKRDVSVIVSGHDQLMYDKSLLYSNLEYLEKFKPYNINRENFTRKHKVIHFNNLNTVGDLLKSKRKGTEALEYFLEAAEILEELEKTPQIKEAKSKLEEKIKEIST